MELNIVQIIINSIDWQLVVLVVSVGELIKRYVKMVSGKVNSFFAVFLSTLPFALIYTYLAVRSGSEPRTLLTSYFFAFWIYPALIKPLKNLIK